MNYLIHQLVILVLLIVYLAQNFHQSDLVGIKRAHSFFVGVYQYFLLIVETRYLLLRLALLIIWIHIKIVLNFSLRWFILFIHRFSLDMIQQGVLQSQILRNLQKLVFLGVFFRLQKGKGFIMDRFLGRIVLVFLLLLRGIIMGEKNLGNLRLFFFDEFRGSRMGFKFIDFQEWSFRNQHLLC